MILPYRYRSLEHKDSLRLLILHPSADDSAPITCSIRHARLCDPALEYEAISYTWGDNTIRQIVYFHNGRRGIHVGINCHDMLGYLRHKHDNRTLWIDAICIDQGNLIERAAQVCIMDEIYASASCVVIHLGKETPGSSLLFQHLVEVDEDKNYDRPRPHDSIVMEMEALV